MKKEASRVAVNREVVDRERGCRWGGIVAGENFLVSGSGDVDVDQRSVWFLRS
jgi:hypothetical protein